MRRSRCGRCQQRGPHLYHHHPARPRYSRYHRHHLNTSPDHAQRIRHLFGELAPSYDLLNRLFSLGLDIGWRRKLVSSVVSHHPQKILDLACGSGDVCLLLQKALPQAEIIGLDFCLPLLEQAKSRGVKQTVEGDALHLPFPDNHCTAVTLAFGLRNFADRARGLNEIHRVLSPNGIFALLEFTPPPAPWNYFWNLYLFHVMPWIAQAIARQGDAFRYLAKSISEFPTPAALNQELHAAGLKLLSARSMSLGLVRCTLTQKILAPR